jgi:hypothetical protein
MTTPFKIRIGFFYPTGIPAPRCARFAETRESTPDDQKKVYPLAQPLHSERLGKTVSVSVENMPDGTTEVWSENSQGTGNLIASFPVGVVFISDERPASRE